MGSVYHTKFFLSTQSTSLYFVMMSCNSELPTFRQRLQQCTPPRTCPCCLQRYFHFTKNSIVSHLTAGTRLAPTSETEWSLRRDHQPARTWLRTDVTPRLHLLEGLFDVSNTCDRRLSRTLLHLSDLIAFVTLSSSSLLDNRSLCPVI